MRYNPYVLPIAIAAIIAVGIALLAWRRRPAPGAGALAVMGLAVCIWTAGYALELATTVQPMIVRLAQIEYIGIVTVPVAWLTFALHYGGYERLLTPIRLVLLATIPIITLILVWTNTYHDLIWEVDFDESGQFVLFSPTYGLWFWVHTVFSYLAVIVGSCVLIRSVTRAPNLYKLQVTATIVAACLPLLANAVYLSEITPWPDLDLTPLAFVISGAVILLSIFRYLLLNMVPVARDLIVESMVDGVIVLDERDRVIDANPAAIKTVNDETILLGRCAGEVFARWSDMVERYRHVHQLEEEIVSDAGPARRYYNLRISPIYDRYERFRGRMIIWRDITDLKGTEEILRRRNDELTALHKTTVGLIDRLDTTNLLEAVVTQAGELVGTAHGYLCVVDPESDELVVRVGTGVFENYLEWRLKRGQGVSGQVWETGESLAINGHQSWLERYHDFDWSHAVVGIPLRSGADVIGVISLAYVETARTFGNEEVKLLERFGHMASLALENARLYAKLHQELAERRQAESALQRAKEEAESANRAKSTFLANMSHELRTPLTLILGYSQLLQMQAREQGYAELIPQLETISSSGDHLLNLISEILDLSKIEAGRMDLHPESFEVACLIDDLATSTRPLIEKHANTLELRLADDLGAMHADMTKVRQILFNLLSNAAKFTENGTVTLVAGRTLQDGAEWILFHVVDTGIGISAEQQTYLFREFSQVDSSATRRHGGSGLGLAISRHFCHIMGGEITLRSVVGKGSTFTVQLPAEVVHPAPGEALLSKEVPEHG